MADLPLKVRAMMLRAEAAERDLEDTLFAAWESEVRGTPKRSPEDVVMESGWRRSQYFWGRIDGWRHPDGLRTAFVVAGLDSQERAVVMVERLPADGSHHRILDRDAVRLRDLDHERWSENGDASEAAFAAKLATDESSGRAWPPEEIDGNEWAP